MQFSCTILCRFILLLVPLTGHTEVWQIATDQNFPPYVYQEQGKIKGLHADLIDAVMQEMGVKYQLATYPWARVVAVTDKRKVVFSFPWISKPERREKYLLVGPLHEGKTVFAVRKGMKGFQYNSLEDLSGFTVGTVRGYAYDIRFDQAKFFNKDDQATENKMLLKKLVNGRVNIIIGDLAVLTTEAKNLNILDRIQFLSKPLRTAERFVAFSKHDTEKAHQFGVALKRIQKNGTYEKILNKYQ